MRRLAYIFGNSNYDKEKDKLPGCINDVTMINQKLLKCGFVTKCYTDIGKEKFSDLIYQFKYDCMNYDMALFYYSGHGFEYRGNNYLCPCDYDYDNIENTNVNITNLVNEISLDRTFVSVIILDCCRIELLLGEKGISEIHDIIPNFRNAGGTYVAYATSSGKKAYEKMGHGVYTKSLCKFIEEPGLQIEQLFKKVRKDLSEKDDFAQVPWEYSSLTTDFYFMEKYDSNTLSINDLGEHSFHEIKKIIFDWCVENNITNEYRNWIKEILNKLDERKTK